MSEKTEEKRSYKSTLNLPKTPFPMKANLVQNEPASQKRWEAMGLYNKLREARNGSPRYVFHDGPPYANGSIHLGHLLNKCLKDFVVRSKTMAGFDCPYVPGWDCHGLPIEHKVVQELGDKAATMEAYQIRRKCQTYAEKFVKLQSGQMQRLLTLADYEHPYLTMTPDYEAAVLEVFADLVAQGLVYRALKPVHWSIANRTALAEAELEYEDREDTSVYVLFDATSSAACGLALPFSLMIWTTTPWTLPANLAVAVHERFEYGLYELEGGRRAVIACELAKKVLHRDAQPLATITGKQLLGIRYKHPFIDRVSPVVPADYVTLEDGTGLVHTAPGHGVEDYQTGLKHGLDIYCPVKEDGTFDDTVPQWLRQPGVDVWKANELVVNKLRDSGHLFLAHKFTHSYPHDWRSKTPTIFRATEQFFVSVDKSIGDSHETVRHRAQRVVEGVKFIPEWGKNRMSGMLKSRPDWCISRQRSWGLPIPAFFAPDGAELLTEESVRAVAAKIRQHGSDYWFKASTAELLADYDPKKDGFTKEAVATLKKGSDIFDVWFDSGTSWAAVIEQRKLGHDWGDGPLTDLYLEGSDQHRGWFQASLLPAVAARQQAPYKTVLTHGFMVDKDGRKMSKSLGNTLEVETLLKEHGADVCRWWVSSINTDNDIKVDPKFFSLAGEEYRKVRNTIRFLLSNLDGYKPAEAHHFTGDDSASLDAWVLSELNSLINVVSQGYEHLHFPQVHEAVFNFCNETISAVYGNAVKDRLYCDAADSPRRRRAQTAIHTIVDALIRMIAPILPHTADEAWQQLHGSESCVHTQLFPETVNVTVDDAWPAVMALRDPWLRAMETARQERGIENPLELAITVPRTAELAKFDLVDLADLCAVSRFELTDSQAITVLDLRSEPRCERCWKRDGTVKARRDGGMLSDRDARALGLE